MLKFSKSEIISNLKWLLLLTIFSLIIASSISIFLSVLEWATNFNESHLYLVYGLPFAGIFIAILYNKYDKNLNFGTNLLIDSFYNYKIKIPWITVPLIFIGTILTHLFGGSAGREGTALQISGGFSDLLLKWFGCHSNKKNILLKAAIAGGFSAVFGTPLAGLFFAFEFFNIGKPKFKGFISVVYVSFLANYLTLLFGINHTSYQVGNIPQFKWEYIFYLLFAGIVFGNVARFFSLSIKKMTVFFKTYIPNSIVRIFVGGLILVILFKLVNTTDYLGLGIPIIEKSFLIHADYEVFILKLIFTIITLSCGFKGGEVTPLFFIGATLGSFLSYYIPIPIGVFAAIGFVSVFSGATNTPIACVFMAMELFGFQILPFAFICCLTSYFCSGYTSIYTSQKITEHKLLPKMNVIGKKISNL